MSADLRYPVGKFVRSPSTTPDARARLVADIAALPARAAAAVQGLSQAQLDTPYREGGWTVRQVVHHMADSHLNAYIRMKLAVTEERPPVKTYDEKAWAELADSRTAPVEVSLALLDALHRRWVGWLGALDEAAFARTVQHPDWGAISIDELVQLYGWHCRHHVAHITRLRERKGW
jgi:uncharacterized damage-inducible protein DinB